MRLIHQLLNLDLKFVELRYMKFQFVFLIFNAFLIYSCGSKSVVSQNLNVYNYDSNKYEIAIHYHVMGRGNVHRPFDFSKYEYDRWHWIYTNKIEGKILADKMVFTFYQRKTEYPWSQSQLRGYVEFKDDSALINLFMPNYNDSNKITGWEPYEFNGRYGLIIKNENAPIMDKELFNSLK
jgi:hypothetical protein